LTSQLGSLERALLSLLSHPAGALDAQTDWDRLAVLAEELWLEPRLAARADANRSIPAGLRQRWLAARRFTAARNLLFQNEEQKLLANLQQCGVEAVPLKGTSLARILGDPAARPVTDIDLGLRAADVARASEVLRNAGYSVALPSSLLKHRSFLAATDEYTSEVKCAREWAGSHLAVELHWKWLSLPEHEVWSAMRAYQPAGVRTLGIEHYFLFLCSHAAGGNWAGLRWLCDIAEFLVVLGARMDASACMHLARKAGLRQAVGITLVLLDAFFGVRFPGLQPLCDARARRAARLYYRRPFQPFLSGTVVGIHRDRMRIQDGPAQRIAYVARLLRPTFQEWADPCGRVRPAASAWALRFVRLARMSVPGARPTPTAGTRP
jgi:hypothetical protein